MKSLPDKLVFISGAKSIPPFIIHSLLLLNYCFLPNPASAQHQSDFPEASISNGWVKMKLYLPDAEKGYYRATRFDWSGVISSLQYDGHEYFGYWKETHNPKVHEDISGPVESYNMPGLGYEEAKPGEGFIRIGVGILEKPDEKEYRTFETYKILDTGTWKTKKGKDWIKFKHILKSDFGYSYIYTKKIKLSKAKPGFIIAHTLKNQGKRKIETDQYNHNFFMIDQEKTGPNLEVSFPYSISTTYDLKGLVKLEKNKLIFLRPFDDNSVYMHLRGFSTKAEDHEFQVLNKRTGAGVKVLMDQPLYQMAFWAKNTTLCPENYIYLSVEPGKKFIWKADYSLFIQE